MKMHGLHMLTEGSHIRSPPCEANLDHVFSRLSSLYLQLFPGETSFLILMTPIAVSLWLETQTQLALLCESAPPVANVKFK